MFTAMGLDEIIKEMSAARKESSLGTPVSEAKDTWNQQKNPAEVEGNSQESMGTRKESEEFPGDGNDLQLQMGLRIQLRCCCCCC